MAKYFKLTPDRTITGEGYKEFNKKYLYSYVEMDSGWLKRIIFVFTDTYIKSDYDDSDIRKKFRVERYKFEFLSDFAHRFNTLWLL